MHGFNIKGGRHFVGLKIVMAMCTLVIIVCTIFAYVDNLSAPERNIARKEVFESKIGGAEGAVQAAVAMVENEYIDKVTAIYQIIVYRCDDSYIYEVKYLSGIIPKTQYYREDHFTTKGSLDSFWDRPWERAGSKVLDHLDLTMILEEAQKCL